MRLSLNYVADYEYFAFRVKISQEKSGGERKTTLRQ